MSQTAFFRDLSLSGKVAESILFMVTRPKGVTIRDLVVLPSSVDL